MPPVCCDRVVPARRTAARAGEAAARSWPERRPVRYGGRRLRERKRGPEMTSELDRLERDAREVRGRLALDVDELMLRLNPRRMAREIAQHARENGIGDGAGREIVREMRRNPIPYLLIAIGLAGLTWAVASASSARTRGRLPEFKESDFAPPPRTAAEPVAPPPAVAPPVNPARQASRAVPAIE